LAGGPQAGFVVLRLLPLLFAVGLLASLVLAEEKAAPPAQEQEQPSIAKVTDIESVEIEIAAPSSKDRDSHIAHIDATYVFEAEAGSELQILDKAHVISDYTIDDRRLALIGEEGVYRLSVLRSGEHRATVRYLTSVAEKDGVWSLDLHVPASLKNRVVIKLPETGMAVASDEAVLLKTQEQDGGSETTLVFGRSERVAITWRPQVRRTALEKAVFFSEMQTLAVCESGVAYLTHLVRYQVAQGELQSLTMRIPERMSVTAVHGVDLGTWRFDPATHTLEALMDRPMSGDFSLKVVTQIPQEGLPYDVGMELPEVVGAVRQRGALALAAPDKVQIRVTDLSGLHPMNIDDFSVSPFHAGGAEKKRRTETVKRAFRYHELPVSAGIHAEQVLPEFRIKETASLDVSDERVVLSSKLGVSVAKAGIFSMTLALPDDYDVESLTGDDVSHWDEAKEDGHKVVVHFVRQVLGERALNLVLARTEKGVGDQLNVPRVRVAEALKHTGTLVVSGERGLRFSTLLREGVSEVNPADLGIKAPGYLAFRLLRPSWGVTLEMEVRAPVVKAEVLQHVDLSQGMIRGQGAIRYRIDNAGVKVFDVQAPRPGVALTFHGKDIAQVQEMDKERGVWRVVLRNKVSGRYALDVSYQEQFGADAGTARIRPLQAVGSDGQKGYLVVMSAERLRVQPTDASPGLKTENARGIPAEFGIDDLEDAVLCYRTTRPDYWLDLAVVRHDSAYMLPAQVHQATLTSIVSDDHQMVTRVLMNLSVGDLRFLRTRLPEGSRLWSALVNGKTAMPLVEEDAILIPLDDVVPSGQTPVELIYAGTARSGRLLGRQRFEGPRFDLPLNNITWSFFLPSRYRYSGFGGTMQPRTHERGGVYQFDDKRYAALMEMEEARSLQMAESVLKKGEQYAREGRQREAKEAFEAAMNYSVGQKDFNEDARIQYRSLAKQQAIVGLVNRRDNLKRNWNVQGEDQSPASVASVEEGRWTQADGQRVEQSLSFKENDMLNKMAECIIDQQAAAAGVVPSIRPTMPLQGRRLDFARPLQIKPMADMTVVMRRMGGRRAMWLTSLLAAAALCWLYSGLLAGLGYTRASA